MTEEADDLQVLLDQCWEMGRTGRSADGLAEAQRLVVLARKAADDHARARALTSLAWFCLQLGHGDEGIGYATEARSLLETSEDARANGLATSVYSWLLIEVGLSELALDAASMAVDIAQGTEDLALQAFATSCKGMALLMIRQDHLAGPVTEAALELAEAAGDPSTIALNLINKGYSLSSRAETALAGGDAEEARGLFERATTLNDRAIAVAGGCGDLWNLRIALCNACESYLALGDIETARLRLVAWDEVPGSVGPRERIHYLDTKAQFLAATGEHEAALSLCEDAAKQAAAGSNLDLKVQTLHRLSEIEAALGRFEAALGHYRGFHDAFVLQTSELARRRAQALDMQLQNQSLRAQAIKLEREALQDPLTGLPNRRAFEAAFSGLEGRAFSLAILDLDHFKSVNDRFTHLVGDAVLTRTGALLGGWDGRSKVFRLGGEEFAVLMPDMEATMAHGLMDTLRQAVAATYWDDLAPGLVVTASIGVADSSEASGRALMELADRHLYAAKEGGRNRVASRLRTERLGAWESRHRA